MIVIASGAWALSAVQGDLGHAFTFEPPGDRGLFQAVMAGTTLAFFAMVGFEDSVNMAEESKNPTRIRSEEPTSELQSLMRISYAVFRLKKKRKHTHTTKTSHECPTRHP